MSYREWIDTYGSPAYVYDLNKVEDAYKSLTDSLPQPSVLFYSLKANPHPMLTKHLIELGCHGEVSSVNETATVLDNGLRADQCLYTGPGKNIQEIEYAIHKGIRTFSVDSRYDLEKLSFVARGLEAEINCLLRINPDEPVRGLSLSMTGVPSQFGFDASSLLEDGTWIRHLPPETKVCGFHIYMGTNVQHTNDLLGMYEKTIDLGIRLAEQLNIPLQMFDLGGGFSHPFMTNGSLPYLLDLKRPLEQMLDSKLPGWRNESPLICFESGRYLVGSSGMLVSKVQDIKMSKGERFVILDSGIHHIGGMAGLGRLVRIDCDVLLLDRDGVEKGEGKKAHIVGPLCTPLDYMSRGTPLPDVTPGDLIGVPNVGAYGVTASLLGFLSRDTPVELVIKNERLIEASQIELIRKTKGES